MSMSSRKTRIEAALTAALTPSHLNIVDDSARHAGHEGARGTETHFNVEICASAFDGMSRVMRARVVHEILRAELENGLHALALVLRTPAEMASRQEPAAKTDQET